MDGRPNWLRAVAVAALVWNLLGLAAFAADMMMSPADLQAMDAAQRAAHEARPAWSIVGTALAVIGGTLGSLGLALYRTWAYPLLVASLLGVLLQDAGLVLATPDALTPVVIGLQALVLVIAVGLVLLARYAGNRGWLR